MMECPMKNLKYFTLSIGNQSNIISGCHILDNVYTRYTIIYSQSEDTDMNYHLWGNPNILRLAEFLKVNFVIYDYSGYGNSIGHLTVETLKENLKRIIKYIHQEYEVPKNKIILWGSSFGGTLSAEVSKEENNLCGLILFNAPNSMLEYLCYINNKMNYIEYKKQKRYSNDFNTCEALSKVKIPTLVVINHNKTNVPHSTSFRIYKSALNPVSPYTVHNNNNINLLQNKDALRRVKEFLIYDI
uniref:Hydrolase_4 domain-containing protein n=1 Tax=Parastrongyloides trichosuri TaxID=131310 RepID=A0A0N4ZY67_PARTI